MTFPTNRYKKEKLSTLLERLAAEHISRSSETSFLTTVTGSRLSDSGMHIDIFISVLPETEEKAAIDFLSRHKKDFSEYVDKHARVGRMPSFDFVIDQGEKNRQRVDKSLSEA